MPESPHHANPVFVVGCERSGSTMLRLMLDHHPELSFPHQYEFSVDWVGDDGSLPEPEAYRRHLEQNSIFRRSGFEIEPGLGFSELQQSFLEQPSRGRPIVGGSIHRHFRRVPHVWPGARYIHLLRDPRPVSRSIVQMGWAGNVWAGAAWWVEAEEEWDRLAQQIDPTCWTEVRYETLVADPEPCLREICSFLGVSYDPHMLDYPDDTTYEAPDAAFVDRWRSSLPARDKARVEARVGGLLEERAYVRESGGRSPGAIERAWLALDDRLGRMRFAWRRYGGGLWLQRWLAQRIGSKLFAERVQERLRTVDERYIR